MQSGDICTESSYAHKGRDGNCKASLCTMGVNASAIPGYKDVDASEEALPQAVAEGPVSIVIGAATVVQFYSRMPLGHDSVAMNLPFFR